jgi:predicted SnoaL-like aldol condensation-catalyzing enzyme
MTAPNKTAIASTFLALCADGRVDEAYERFVAPGFTHHNAYFPGDRESLRVAMRDSAMQEPNRSFEIKQVVEDADRVAVLSHLRRTDSGTEYAVVHMLRFNGDQIAEMWDVGQEIPADSPNALGMF